MFDPEACLLFHSNVNWPKKIHYLYLPASHDMDPDTKEKRNLRTQKIKDKLNGVGYPPAFLNDLPDTLLTRNRWNNKK